MKHYYYDGINTNTHDDNYPADITLYFMSIADAEEWVKEQKINEQVDEALKDYESNPGCGNQCNSKPI